MMSESIIPHQWLYAHVHRLGPLFKQITGRHILSVLPYRFKSNGRCLNTLWHNEKSSLGFAEHIELRDAIDDCIALIVRSITGINLGIFESGAIDINDNIGSYVYFSAQFRGQDIPDQDEFLRSGGKLPGPQGTLRREVRNDEDPYDVEFIESCLMMEARYFYSDSSFFQLGEIGNWTGLGLLNAIRSINSANGQHRRTQLIITPLCIASTASVSSIKNGASVYELYKQI